MPIWLTTVAPPKGSTFPMAGLVQHTPVRDGSPAQEVLLDGQVVGSIASQMTILRPKASGAARMTTGKPRKVWSVARGAGRYGRVKYGARVDAVIEVLRVHAVR